MYLFSLSCFIYFLLKTSFHVFILSSILSIPLLLLSFYPISFSFPLVSLTLSIPPSLPLSLPPSPLPVSLSYFPSSPCPLQLSITLSLPPSPSPSPPPSVPPSLPPSGSDPAVWWMRWTSLAWSWMRLYGSSRLTSASRAKLRRWRG